MLYNHVHVCKFNISEQCSHNIFFIYNDMWSYCLGLAGGGDEKFMVAETKNSATSTLFYYCTRQQHSLYLLTTICTCKNQIFLV